MPGRSPADVEQRLWAQLEDVRARGVTQAELGKAVKQTRAQFAFTTETATNQAFWMGFCSMFADHTWLDSYVKRLSAVTPADVQRVANQFLTRDKVTVGQYLANG
jgi:zinc protease